MNEERPVLLNTDGRTLLYHEVVDEAGTDSPWLVFVHGAGGSIRTWKYQIDAFRPHYRLLLIDLRDHGFSKDILPEFPQYDFDIVSADILAVVDHLGIERANFVSLSIGSVILQKIDIERPELIDRMVMAGAIFDGSRLMHWFVHSGKLLNYILPYQAIYWIFSFIVLPRRNHRMSRWIFRRQSLRLTPREYLKWVELYKPFFHLIKQYVERRVDKRGLVVMGSQDHIFFSAAEKFARAQKNMRLAVIENCGHVCSIEAPELFNELVLKFLSNQDVPARVIANPVPSSWSELKALKG
ncbi:MAG: 2-succinyl-6-hydroxy-2,4-cyclohexadiene-1-carboxylate synthase [Crocinitomicaceae bacterium]|nr:2-succinyl-6-hydroxy-2,4-cyclohexadiene-1-carboxylate synthase [Crocinitomicaceae bacterium]